MFTLLSGPFHPNLESALVQQVQQIKAADPRAPLAIIVPSESLRRRLQWVLCAEHFCTLFDVHFLTFHQLALYLQAERQAVNPPDDTVPSLALRNPKNLHSRMSEVNSNKQLVRHVPGISQVQNWVVQAKELPRVVSH